MCVRTLVCRCVGAGRCLSILQLHLNCRPRRTVSSNTPLGLAALGAWRARCPLGFLAIEKLVFFHRRVPGITFQSDMREGRRIRRGRVNIIITNTVNRQRAMQPGRAPVSGRAAHLCAVRAALTGSTRATWPLAGTPHTENHMCSWYILYNSYTLSITKCTHLHGVNVQYCQGSGAPFESQTHPSSPAASQA